MKFRKLLEKARSLLDAEERKSKVKKKSLKLIIKKLRKREKGLQVRLKKEASKSKSAKISEQINLAHAQRKKGLEVLKRLKKS